LLLIIGFDDCWFLLSNLYVLYSCTHRAKLKTQFFRLFFADFSRERGFLPGPGHFYRLKATLFDLANW